jgi:chromosome segregation ATPase
MATKSELEAEVEQLRAQIAADKPADLTEINLELDQLKRDLGKTVSERDYNWEQLQKSKAQAADLEDQLGKVTQSALEGNDALKIATDQIADLRRDLDNAKAGVVGESGDKNHVRLDGVTYDVIWRSTVRDLAVEGYQKRNLHEDQTAIVITKPGG